MTFTVIYGHDSHKGQKHLDQRELAQWVKPAEAVLVGIESLKIEVDGLQNQDPSDVPAATQSRLPSLHLLRPRVLLSTMSPSAYASSVGEQGRDESTNHPHDRHSR